MERFACGGKKVHATTRTVKVNARRHPSYRVKANAFAFRARMRGLARHAAEELRVGAERLMHSLHGHAAFAHGGGAALHRTRTDVARSENAGAARLQRSRWALRGFPCGGISDCGACFYEAFVIALDLRR